MKIIGASILAVAIISICLYVFATNSSKRQLKFTVDFGETGYGGINPQTGERDPAYGVWHKTGDAVTIRNLNEFDIHGAKLTIDSYQKSLFEYIGDIKINQASISEFKEDNWTYKIDAPALDPSSSDYYLLNRTIIRIEATEGVFEATYYNNVRVK